MSLPIPVSYLTPVHNIFLFRRTIVTYRTTLTLYHSYLEKANKSHGSRHHPEKVKGVLAPAVMAKIPRAASKIMDAGWKEHIPLTILTDAYCESKDALKPLPETMQLDADGKLVITNHKVPSSNRDETSLELEEWLQAWGRLLSMIHNSPKFHRTHKYWRKHFKHIFLHAERQRKWPLLIRYDIEVRLRSTMTDIDMGTWQEEIYKQVENDYQNPPRVHPAVGPSFTAPSSYTSRSSNSRGIPSTTNTGARPTTRPIAPLPTNISKPQSRCFRCGTLGHFAQTCNQSSRPGGKPFLISRLDDGSWLLDGKPFCYKFNSPRGCPAAASQCQNAPHICSLCRSTSHGAQQCPA